jgi:hypothetical protein
MTPYQVEFLRRAALARKLRIRYRLGTGGRRPDAETPADDQGRCDCSGLTAWLGGRDRVELMPGTRKEIWYSTRGMVDDAIGKGRYTSGFSHAAGPRRRYRETDVPQVGDLVVYTADALTGRDYGHVAGVTGAARGMPPEWDPTSLACWRALLVTHCHGPDGLVPSVEETPATLWGRLWGRANGTVILRPV